VRVAYPADAAAYGRGELGVVAPTYARWHLIQAYRRFIGVAPANDATPGWPSEAAGRDAIDAWFTARERVQHVGEVANSRSVERYRAVPGAYSSILNCGADALRTAAMTLDARIGRFGAESASVRAWVEAQDPVFANCHDGPAVVPQPASPSDDPLIRADRAYQIAAAAFYAFDYVKAETLFKAIGEDRSSPWQSLGRYLAARAMIRRGTVALADSPDQSRAALEAADRELAAVEADPSLAIRHASAKQLRQWVALHINRPAALRELMDPLERGRPPTSDEFLLTTRLMDQVIDEGVDYAYGSIVDRDQLVENGLLDWMLAFQATGDDAKSRLLSRWRETHALPWLVAAM
jgi:hypothetical protein